MGLNPLKGGENQARRAREKGGRGEKKEAPLGGQSIRQLAFLAGRACGKKRKRGGKKNAVTPQASSFGASGRGGREKKKKKNTPLRKKKGSDGAATNRGEHFKMKKGKICLNTTAESKGEKKKEGETTSTRFQIGKKEEERAALAGLMDWIVGKVQRGRGEGKENAEVPQQGGKKVVGSKPVLLETRTSLYGGRLRISSERGLGGHRRPLSANQKRGGNFGFDVGRGEKSH